MTKQVNKLSKTIMRRVYYAFAIRLATHSVTKHVVLLALFGYVLARLVHVAAVYRHIVSVEVGDLGVATFKMFLNADLPTLLVVGLVFFTILSLPRQLQIPKMVNLRTTSAI